MKPLLRLLVFSALVLVPAFAQTATVDGIVTDSSQAVIAGALVTITNLDTGLRREAHTNQTGNYTFTQLPIGRYKVDASMAGFSTESRPELKLDVDQVVRLDFTLKPGTLNETVEVSAAAALLDSETATVGQVISNKSIVEMPLNGRNYLSLAALTAGTAPDVGGRTESEGGFAAGGAHAYQMNVQVDGLDNNTIYSGGPIGYQAQAVKPSIDAIGEFKVVTNNLSAEYGGRMGGTVLVTIKSGTNQFHGTAYEFLRNDALDGTNFFANLSGASKPEYRQNQFGGTLGGPIRKNKLFLFGSFDATRIRSGTSSISTVPTAAEDTGNFSAIRPIFDPLTTNGTGASMTRQMFPGDIIPKSRWDPLFPALLALYPTPTNPGIVNNYYFSGVDRDDWNNYDFKGDENFNDNNRLSVRYSRRDLNQYQNGPLPLPADGGLATTTAINSNSFVGSYIRNLSPTMNNELRIGQSRMPTVFDIPYDKPLFDQFGIKGIPKTNFASSNNHGLTLFNPSGYAEVGSRAFWPNTNNSYVTQVNDVLFRSAGNHGLKVGFEFMHENVFRVSSRYARGLMTFNREFTADPQNRAATGDGLAEFMLGWAAAGNLGNENGENLMTNSLAAFIQDDWKLSPRLTLNLGLRYDIFFAPTFPDDHVSNFVLDYSQTGPNGRLQEIRPQNGSDCGCQQNFHDLGPRVGLAYRLTNKTVLRSGFGIVYAQEDSFSSQSSRWMNQSPDFVEYSFATIDRINPLLILQNGFPPVQLPATSVPGPAAVGITSQSANMPDQYSEQWFFDLQRELPYDTLMTIGYSGNGAHHMIVPLDYDVPYGPAPSPVASRRNFPYYTAVTRQMPMGNSSYNALVWKMEKRFSKGLSFLSAFTWAHTIDDLQEVGNGTANEGPVVPWNIELNRGNSYLDIRRQWAFSAAYELPFGKGKPWLNHGGIVNALLGGWQVAPLITMRSGIPFTVVTSGGITNAGGADRPNRIGNGTLPSGQQTIYHWFDTSAFVVQPQYTYGNSGRNILFGPNLRNLDLSLSKSFALTETKHLQFRAESFNLTNTPPFGQPNATLNGLGVGQITSAGNPRYIQFALKFIM
ncbi:MAG TPA: carboxypeptidase regulatory-like domain-containing protein [Bryobacteraceae bacterium]|nr:carboxypeptidase regulatory-like domain-containing protein [Bryobacteraceae bacterium]